MRTVLNQNRVPGQSYILTDSLLTSGSHRDMKTNYRIYRSSHHSQRNVAVAWIDLYTN